MKLTLTRGWVTGAQPRAASLSWVAIVARLSCYGFHYLRNWSCLLCVHWLFLLVRDYGTFSRVNLLTDEPCGFFKSLSLSRWVWLCPLAGLQGWAHTKEQGRSSGFWWSLATRVCNWSKLQVKNIVWFSFTIVIVKSNSTFIKIIPYNSF